MIRKILIGAAALSLTAGAAFAQDGYSTDSHGGRYYRERVDYRTTHHHRYYHDGDPAGHALAGGAAGAGVGAAIGCIVTIPIGCAPGAAIGAAVGGGTGAVAGAATTHHYYRDD